jgi:hypothetical protein
VLELHHLRPDFLFEPALDGVEQRRFLDGIGMAHGQP